MKTFGAIVVVLLLVTAGCGFCPPSRARAEIQRNRDEFRRAGREARLEMQRARIELRRELRNAREDIRREMRQAHRDVRHEFDRW
jgi:hypothetical protein